MSRVVESALSTAKTGLARLQEHGAHGQKLVFFHVPKCGGTSIDSAFRRAITFHGLGARPLDPKASKQAADAIGDDYLDLRERWLVYQVQRAQDSYIHGHFPWSPAIPQVKGDYRLVTLVRDPRAQLLSEFFFNRDKTNVGHFSIERDTPLKQFLTTPVARDIGTKFVQYFTDPPLRRAAAEPEAVEAACRNLALLDVVGTLEHLDDWTAQVGALLGRPLEVGRERVSPTPKSRRDAEVDDEATAMIDELVRPNRAVYERVLELSGAATGRDRS